MKVRSSTYATAYRAPSPAASVGGATSAPPLGGVEQARANGDAASILGISAAELTPKVQAALGQLMAEVQSLRDELDIARKRIGHLEELADSDSLTSVLNRRAFVRELSRMISFAERYGAAGSLIYLDVNGMKPINDGYGHRAGDAVLDHVAETLKGQLRETDVVGRLGGDEFGVILHQADTVAAGEKARNLAEAIQAEPVTFEEHRLQVRVAYGVHSFAPGDQADEALDAADRAMYEHKISFAAGARGS